ncbi:MAG: hypothetical protein II949_03280 [Prevotella sp.]|nr:hypothetical protein [Prevotella sp.]
MIHNISRYIMTLALLLTAVTGVWAEEATITLNCGTTEKTFEKAELPWSSTVDILKEVISDFGMAPGIQSITGGDGKVVKIDKELFQVTGTFSGKATVEVSYINTSFTTSMTTITVTAPGPAEPAIEVTPGEAANTWTFVMPAFDVEIAPIYAPKAVFATDGNLVLIPTAIEGIYAESTDAIVTAGTVAKIGETENPQGIVMYAVTSTNQATAPALTAFSADVPTAKDIKVGSEVLVWYYIKGADTPTGQEATAENTFNDSEICAEPIEVKILSNKFDIQFKAANDNTIETGKATVKVGETDAEVKEGKLTGVKMNSKVTVTAKDGYKFRKVEVKKGGAAAPTTTVTWNSSDFYFDENPYTKDGVTLTPSNDMAASGNNLYQFGDNTFTTTLGKFTKIEIEFESTTYNFDGWTKGTGEQYQPDPQTYPDWWENLLKLTWTGDAESVTIKGKDVFGIHSITFTIQ